MDLADHAVLGNVRVVSEELMEQGFLRVANSHSGSQATCDLLLKEARKPGADVAINVWIDRRDVDARTILDSLISNAERYACGAIAIAMSDLVCG